MSTHTAQAAGPAVAFDTPPHTPQGTFAAALEEWPRERRDALMARATPDRVRDALEREHLRPGDFLLLLTPAARPFLEAMARRAHAETARHFGRAVQLFTPLYLSDHCTNQCRYCGFNARNKQPRRHLSLDEAEREARAIAAMGLGHILLLTGDARHVAPPEYIAAVAARIKPLFASVSVEIYALSEEEYALLCRNGVDGMTMFQETYNPTLYAALHPAGPKRDYGWRLAAPERAAAAGMYSMGLGALLGLDALAHDGFCTGLHAHWLQHAWPGVDVSVSVPRMCPHEGSFDVPHPVDDHAFVQYITALRCFLPRAGITVSTREAPHMRDNLVPLGVTRVSAGVSTAVGGRADKATTSGQFEISDHRDVPAMAAALAARGYQAVLKDWQDACIENNLLR